MTVSQIQEISEKIKEFGVVSVNDLLNSEQFKLADNILKNFHSNQYKKGDCNGTSMASRLVRFYRIFRFFRFYGQGR